MFEIQEEFNVGNVKHRREDKAIKYSNIYFVKKDEALMLIINYFQANEEGIIELEKFLLKIDEEGSVDLKEGEYELLMELIEASISTPGILFFLKKYQETFLPYLDNYLKEVNFNIFEPIKSDRKSIRKYFEYLLFEPNAFEKFAKSSNEKMILSHLASEEPIMKDGGKLSKTVGLNKETIDIIDKAKMSHLIEDLRKLGSMNDSYPALFVDYINLYKKLMRKFKRLKYENFYTDRFLRDLIVALNYGYKLQPLLNYLSKQQLLYAPNAKAGHYDLDNNRFKLPIHTLDMLIDYNRMAKDMGVENLEKYPSLMFRSHNLFAENYKLLKGDEQAFKDEAAKRSYLEVSNDKYCFIVPKSIKDLLKEGNTLHHCVGSYADKIVKEGTIVVFFRNKEELDEPFVTVELLKSGKSFKVVQAKGMFHEDPEEEIFEAITSLSKKIKGGK